jgi:hypothetical protein
MATTTLNPPKLRRRIDTDTPVEDTGDDQPQLTLGPPLDNAQDAGASPALSLGSGYTAMPVAPTGVMGGEQTKPDDMSQKIQAATAVESKGGPPVSELSASAGKGPVTQGLIKQPLRKPKEAEATATPPETKPEPIVPRAIQPGAETPVKKALPLQAQPLATPTPATTQTPAEPQTQEVPHSLQDQAFVDRIKAQGGDKFLAPTQDFSQVSPDDRNDPNFAGVSRSDANHPPRAIFMDSRGLYIRNDDAPGEETRHYFNAVYGQPDYEAGVKHSELKPLYEEAQTKLTGILEAKSALEDYRAKAQNFQKMGQGENWLQAQELAVQNDPEAPWWQRLIAHGGGALPGPTNVTPEMRDLDEARNRVGVTMTQGILKGVSAREAMKVGLPPLPLTTDPLEVQLQKAKGLEDYINAQTNAIYSQNPTVARWLRQSQQNQEKARAGQSAAASASPSASPSPSATPARQPTYEEAQAAPQIKTTEDLKKYKSGTLVRDLDGKLKYIP